MTTTVDQLTERLTRLLADSLLPYRKPVIGDYKGDVRLSWNGALKSLVFTIAPNGDVLYMKLQINVWDNDMEEGVNPTDAQIVELWKWLYPETVVA